MEYKVVKIGTNKKSDFILYCVFNGFDILATFKVTISDKFCYNLKLNCESFGDAENIKEIIIEYLKNNKKNKSYFIY